MNKIEFLEQLRSGLSGIPQDDIDERIAFYNEMIDDKMEEGCSEQKAVEAMGSVDDIVAQIISETPFTKIAKERIKPNRKFSALEIVLIAIGSPIWLSLLIAAISVLFSLYVVLWSVIIAVWATFVSLVAYSVSCLFVGFDYTFANETMVGISTFSLALLSAGFSMFIFLGCRSITNSVIKFTKIVTIWIKNRIIKKEVA